MISPSRRLLDAIVQPCCASFVFVHYTKLQSGGIWKNDPCELGARASNSRITLALRLNSVDINPLYQSPLGVGLEFFAMNSVFAVVYLIPTFVATLRYHRNSKAICALNVGLGLTVLGWIGALVWALTDNVLPNIPRLPFSRLAKYVASISLIPVGTSLLGYAVNQFNTMNAIILETQYADTWKPMIIAAALIGAAIYFLIRLHKSGKLS